MVLVWTSLSVVSMRIVVEDTVIGVVNEIIVECSNDRNRLFLSSQLLPCMFPFFAFFVVAYGRVAACRAPAYFHSA